jgi:hypothetical protein
VDLVDRLLRSDEPSIRLQVRHRVQGAAEAEVADLREQVRRSSRVATLLSERNADGTISAHPYRAKWYGAHWVLVTLAELGYPAGDEALIPLREQMLDWLFSSDYLGSLGRVHGLPRLHGSIEGNALWAMLRLGLAESVPKHSRSGCATRSGPMADGTVTARPAGAALLSPNH